MNSATDNTFNLDTIHVTFSKVAARLPDKIAVSFNNQSVSYKALDERSNYLASYLVSVGVRKGDIIAVYISRSVEMLVSMLAILKSGGAYLPLDNNNPDSRNKRYMDLANVKYVIGDSQYDVIFESILFISTANINLFSSVKTVFKGPLTSRDDKCYVMFTSGSTGRPKGVVIPHRGVTRLVYRSNYIDIEQTDKILQLASTAFDASTFEIWGALLNGAELVVYSGDSIDPNTLKGDLLKKQVSILWLTAALFHIVVDKFIESLSILRVLLAGGDVLNPKYVNKMLETYPKTIVINGYGPTENTTFTCCHQMSKENKPIGAVPIGRAISGTEIHILDSSLKPVRKGEIGELFVSGDGVALGYLGENTQSTLTFFCNKSISETLLYRTGDLVQENSDGDLLFVGRIDNQIKVRGYRVSLEEIKTELTEFDKISDAIVTYSDGEAGDPLITAYIKSDSCIKISDVKSHLSTIFPSALIPQRIIFCNELPITENGKLDQKLVKIID